MDILNKPIKSFDFSKIESFCIEGVREGLQIDYKKELPKDGLSKLIAAFSNTTGGVIIIGVEEDRTTGIPSSWTGVPVNAQDIERIHQWASNITPFPLYEVHPTNEVKGMNFLLIRVFEGDRTPYYVQNDPKIYVRTGNITPSVDLASPEATELLVRKKEKAEIARNIYVQKSKEVYEHALKRGERERIQRVENEKKEFERQRQEAANYGSPAPTFRPRIYQHELGTNTSVLHVTITPYNPTPMVSPFEIRDRLKDIRDGDGKFPIHFPELGSEPVQDGVMYFSWGEDDGLIHCEQLYSNGFIKLSRDVMTVETSGYRFIYISHVSSLVFAVMKAATNFYKLFGYQGGIKGSIILSSTNGVYLKPILSGQEMFPYEEKIALMSHYDIPFELDSSILNEPKMFQEYFVKLISELFWTFGYDSPHPDTVNNYLKNNRWFVE